MRLIRQLDIADQLSRTNAPALACVGQLGPITPAADGVEIASALPEGVAWLTIINGAGHSTWKDAQTATRR